jgi:membrane-associated phospholipid phosphatase
VKQYQVKPGAVRLLGEARSWFPRDGEDVLRQCLIMLVCYVAYAATRWLAYLIDGREAAARANGLFFMNLEKALGMYWEPWIQGRASAVEPVMTVLVWAYSTLHLPVIIGLLIWVFARRRDDWTRYRNWFLAMNFMAVTVFALLPTMPPRMLFTSGVADISYLYGIRTEILENGLLANPFAAMPSLHFGYALFVGVALYALSGHRHLRWAGFGYAALVLVAIVATGNHFIIDALGGALVALAAWVFAVSLQPAESEEPAAVPVRERES